MIVAALCGIAGLLSAVPAAVLLGDRDLWSPRGRIELQPVLLAEGILLFILAAAFLSLGWGAWRLKRWAWSPLAVTSVLAMLVSLFNLRLLVHFLIAGAITLYYLSRPAVRAAFGRHRPEGET